MVKKGSLANIRTLLYLNSELSLSLSLIIDRLHNEDEGV